MEEIADTLRPGDIITHCYTPQKPSIIDAKGDLLPEVRRAKERGVIFDVDPKFANTEEWWQAIPEEVRPRKDQPFYHLLAENSQTTYVAYVSEQNLLPDDTGKPVSHPQVPHFFKELKRGHYVSRERALH